MSGGAGGEISHVLCGRAESLCADPDRRPASVTWRTRMMCEVGGVKNMNGEDDCGDRGCGGRDGSGLTVHTKHGGVLCARSRRGLLSLIDGQLYPITH